jgi:3-deoxy-manno-octulosonate cytidylyltransferase (CMP-KDO synthetase)
MKIIGIIPARMAASRFPGKPLYPIHGRPMLEHVYRRARCYRGWDQLILATCDEEIAAFARAQAIPLAMTGSHHTRALDRVAEAASAMRPMLAAGDIVVCVQGDEPMLEPDMIEAVIGPLRKDDAVPATVLSIHITEESQWRHPDIVKVIHNAAGEVLYTSRVPVPYSKHGFSADLMARRIGGIFAFRWHYLQAFTAHPETRLEQLEACDSNRILDMPFRQFIAPYRSVPAFSVDSPADIELVERHMDPGEYRDPSGL